MNNNIDISREEFDMIERFILNEMSAEEHERFTKELAGNNALRQKVKELQLLFVGVQETALTKKIEDFHRQLPGSERGTKHTVFNMAKMRRWLTAASIVFIMALGTWIFFGQNKEEQLFSAYYKPDPGLISAMSTSDNYSFDKAMVDYKTGNYEPAIRAWEALLLAKPGNDTLNYFIGSAYLASDNTKKATWFFNKVITLKNSYFLGDAYWYLGLVQLREGKVKDAIPYLEQATHQQKEALLSKLR